MSKTVADLSPNELAEMARSAWDAAGSAALSRGLPVTGSHDGRRFRYHPDGRIEDLGPVEPLIESDAPVDGRSEVA